MLFALYLNEEAFTEERSDTPAGRSLSHGGDSNVSITAHRKGGQSSCVPSQEGRAQSWVTSLVCTWKGICFVKSSWRIFEEKKALDSQNTSRFRAAVVTVVSQCTVASTPALSTPHKHSWGFHQVFTQHITTVIRLKSCVSSNREWQLLQCTETDNIYFYMLQQFKIRNKSRVISKKDGKTPFSAVISLQLLNTAVNESLGTKVVHTNIEEKMLSSIVCSS